MRSIRWLPLLLAVIAGIVVTFTSVRDARAVPSFARKYQTSCLTCHTVFPVLNPFGEAFRRNGYRFPLQNGSTDGDQIKGATIPMGQEEYRSLFPNAVLPDKIMDAVPLSVMMNGNVAYNFGDSDAHAAAGNKFNWAGLDAEFHVFGAGAFNDNLTYFAEVTLTDAGVSLEHGYLLWNDIVGPNHLFNLWVGRLMNPQLTSFGLHSSYLSDTQLPGISLSGLYNAGAGRDIAFMGKPNGVELSGIAGHRVGYAIGWIASTAQTGLLTPNSEDVYAHLGAKIGGMSLDGEGPCGATIPDAMRPWAETSLTLDAYAYSGMTVFDNGTGANVATPAPLVAQRDRYAAVGAAARAQVGSLQVTTGAQWRHHTQPYVGTAGIASDPTQTPATPAYFGVPDGNTANALVHYGEIDYVVFPWLVPGVRTEYTRIDLNSRSPSVDPRSGTYASVLRVIPGVAMLARPNIRVILTGDLERVYGLPPAGSWGAAGASIAPSRTVTDANGKFVSSMLEAEAINATVAVAF